MRNYIFTYKEENYITTFDTGHTRPCEKITNIPAHIMARLLPDLTNPIYIEVEDVTWDKWKDMHVKGRVTLEGTVYLINTQDKSDPVKAITNEHVIESLPIIESEPILGEPSSAVLFQVSEIEIIDPFPDNAETERIEALSQCLDEDEFEEVIRSETILCNLEHVQAKEPCREREDMGLGGIEIGEPMLGNDHINDTSILNLYDPIIQDSLERVQAEALHEEEMRREEEEWDPAEIEYENSIWDALNALPIGIYGVIEEWTETIPNKDILLQEGDIFCIENDWHWIDGYYIIDNSKLLIRYLHSDSNSIDLLCIPYEEVMRRRQN